MFSLFSTYKPEIPLTSDLFTRSEQQLMEESGGVYCHRCNKYLGVHSQTMSPAGKDINKFTNLSSIRKERMETQLSIM